MITSKRVASGYTLFLGLFLLTAGVWGLFNDIVFKVLTTCISHALIHIVLGIAGLWFSIINKPRIYCLVVGAILLIAGILFFVPFASQQMINTLNLNYSVACLNIILGVVTLLVAFALQSKKHARVEKAY